jgi:hypothetical protein
MVFVVVVVGGGRWGVWCRVCGVSHRRVVGRKDLEPCSTHDIALRRLMLMLHTGNSMQYASKSLSNTSGVSLLHSCMLKGWCT